MDGIFKNFVPQLCSLVYATLVLIIHVMIHFDFIRTSIAHVTPELLYACVDVFFHEASQSTCLS